MIRNDDGTQINRYDTKENWLRVNPILEQGEFVVEFDNGGFSVKVGDGSTNYKDLKYISGLNASHPIGSIYMTINEVNPSVLFGGTWELLKDRFLVGAGNSYQVGEIGGEATHTLTVDEMPNHSHINCIYNQNNTYYDMAFNAIRLKTGANAYEWVDIENEHKTAGSNGGDPCGITRSVGRNKPHNNLPPFLAVNIWKRIS